MKIKYSVKGIIEITLHKEDIKDFNSSPDKAAFLQQYFINALDGCSATGEMELDLNVNFGGLKIEAIENK